MASLELGYAGLGLREKGREVQSGRGFRTGQEARIPALKGNPG